ncbi:MAG: ribosomal-processing cysteine protease Prp [Clostridiales bacterium]|nr:ribosomal-processing cysteine protease Prp [Clostridiales bacterium]
MIRVVVTNGTQGIEEVEIKGHSGYAENGKDIVCSAVSAITQTALMGLINVSSQKVNYEKSDKEGYLRFSVPKHRDETEKIKQQAILETMIIGLRDIQKGFSAFVKVEVN